MRRELAALVVVLAGLVSGVCSGNDRAPFALDGTARTPDDEGLVTAVDLSSITLDGDRTYRVDDDLVSFSTIDLSAVPLLFTEGQYVQVGVHGKTASWVGAIARPLTTKPPTVVFEGKVKRVDDAELVFANGTVLAVDDGVRTTGLAERACRSGCAPTVTP